MGYRSGILDVSCALRGLLFPLLCAGLLLHGAGAAAHLPEPYGRSFVPEPPASAQRGAASAKDGEGGESDALEQARETQRLEDALAALQARAGPYAAQLSDPLLQLATRHARQGNPVAALRRLDQALHVLRVNNGLLHPAQLPILREQPALYVKIGDYDSAQRVWRYIYRIHGLGQLPLGEDALRDALAYFQFARDAAIAPTGTGDARRFLEAYRDNEDLYERLLADDASETAHVVAVAISFLRCLYILLGTDTGAQMGSVPSELGTASLERMQSLQTLALRKGLAVLDQLLELRAGAAASERARLLVERGNWLQWNGKWRAAAGDYGEALGLLDDSAAAAVLRAELAVPAVLPEDGELWRSLQGDDVPARVVASASFRVTDDGTARDIVVQAEGEGSQTLAGRIRRLLADSHFRPALRDGGPREASVTGLRYRLVR